MTRSSCEEMRRRLALGEPEDACDLADHLSRCAACSAEAALLRHVLEQVAADSHLEPSPELDRRVLRLLTETPQAVPPLLRPFMAGGLAAAGFIALVSAGAGALALAGAGEQGVLAALSLGLGYLAFSAAASLPVLVYHLRGTGEARA